MPRNSNVRTDYCIEFKPGFAPRVTKTRKYAKFDMGWFVASFQGATLFPTEKELHEVAVLNHIRRNEYIVVDVRGRALSPRTKAAKRRNR